MGEYTQTVIISALTATVTTLIAEPIKLYFKNKFKIYDIKNISRREHDIELFETLSKILPEGVLRGAMYSIRVNGEIYFEYIKSSDQYQLYVENYESAKFINDDIQKAHRKFLEALDDFESDLFDDIVYSSSGTHRIDKSKGITEEEFRNKYTPLTENVLDKYEKYRKLVKSEYNI